MAEPSGDPRSDRPGDGPHGRAWLLGDRIPGARALVEADPAPPSRRPTDPCHRRKLRHRRGALPSTPCGGRRGAHARPRSRGAVRQHDAGSSTPAARAQSSSGSATSPTSTRSAASQPPSATTSLTRRPRPQRRRPHHRARAQPPGPRAHLRDRTCSGRSCSPRCCNRRSIAAAGPDVVFVSSGGMYTARADADDLELEREPFDGPRFYAHAKRAAGDPRRGARRAGERRERRPSPRCIPVGSDTPGLERVASRLPPPAPAVLSATRRRAPTPRSGCSAAARRRDPERLLARPSRRAPHRLPWTHERAAERAGWPRSWRSGRQRLRTTRRASAPPTGGRPMSRVAVVGAGVSGLVAARELDRAGHEIAVFESGRTPAATQHGHGRDAGGSRDVDTGFIVFNDRNYPNFERLLAELGVATQPADDELRRLRRRAAASSGRPRPRGVFATAAHLVDPRFHRMLARPRPLLPRSARPARRRTAAGPSLRDFLDRRAATRATSSSACSVPQVCRRLVRRPGADLDDFPAALPGRVPRQPRRPADPGRPRWRSIVGGSRALRRGADRAVRRPAAPRAPVRAIRRDATAACDLRRPPAPSTSTRS